MNSSTSIPQLQEKENGLDAGTPKLKARSGSRMEPSFWIPSDAASLLDVGCNTGALLCDMRRGYPKMELAGIDINHSALETARALLPGVEIHEGVGFELPFASQRFEYVTCIEVIEHVPAQFRKQLVSEMQRVLRPGGRLILRCPHAGIFDWLDAQNFRFRFPRLYGRLVGQGGRDENYREAQEELVWHHHFTREELHGIAGEGWQEETCQYGGLLLFPISDILRWPFYRMKRNDNWFVRAMERIATAELALGFGTKSYDILLVLRKR
jgi:SAM-dependent methyltransferase